LLVVGYSLDREEEDLGLAEDPGVLDQGGTRGLRLGEVEALDFIGKGFVPGFIESMAWLQI